MCFCEGLKRSRWLSRTQSSETPDHRSPHLSPTFFALRCNNWTRNLQELPGLNPRWQVFCRWALGPGRTPAAFEACGVAVSQQIPHVTCVSLSPVWLPLAVLVALTKQPIGPDRGGTSDIMPAFQKERRCDVKLSSVSVECDVFTEYPGTAPLMMTARVFWCGVVWPSAPRLCGEAARGTHRVLLNWADSKMY